jgi:xylulose-5-phosphate/fructose-6-phosphate phosphoketolase
MADGSTTSTDETREDPPAGVTTAPAGLTGSDTGDDNAEDAAEAPAGSPSREPGAAPQQPTDGGDPQHVAVRYVASELEPYLPAEELARLDAWWRAANYVSVGQIYLLDNPLLREPLRPEHVKPRLLGHWGTTPGLNLIYAHMNRAIIQRDLDAIYVFGPGHGGPAAVAGAWLDGTYSEIYGDVTQDTRGLRRLFQQFSFPGGIPSHVAPETPGSIHEGGELGYALSHAFGAAFDNPDLVVACVVGDGEAESGPLATSWHSNKFLDPRGDGAVLPILHLNGYKIANPTVLARIPEDELVDLFVGYGWQPVLVSGSDPEQMHHAFARALDRCLDSIRDIQRAARDEGVTERPRWPMIVLRSPKGWTGPKVVDGKPAEGSWRSHQVPLSQTRTSPEHLHQLEEWLRSYAPEELFTSDGAPVDLVRSLAPTGQRRMSDNLHTNGGKLLKDLRMPDFRDYAVEVERPGTGAVESTKVLGTLLRDVMRENEHQRNFRVFSPDENNSNRLQDVLQVTTRAWQADLIEGDDNLGPHGRVMEILSEHTLEGWLEGYLVTGRHGFFSCYEAFIHIIDSMFNQHAKWLKVTKKLPWRRPIASLNYLLTSHVWRQDHNGFSHQDPGFIDHVVNKKAEVIRVYLPPDANTLLSVADHCLRSKDYVNVIVAGKQPALQYLSMDEAIVHCTKGIGIWEWASTDAGADPDIVFGCAGDIPTQEALAAVDLLLGFFPDLKVRFVNVVDLMRLQDAREHPHGLSDTAFDALFTRDKPVIFNYHGYPWLIHRLTYRRHNHQNLHVRGYKEEGTTTTPFDMAVINEIDRFHLAIDAIDRLPHLGDRGAHFRQQLEDQLIRHRLYIREQGEDLPEVRQWQWSR